MMNMKKNIILFAFLFVGVLTGYCQQSAYLFVYFTGNRMSEEAVRMAVSSMDIIIKLEWKSAGT